MGYICCSRAEIPGLSKRRKITTFALPSTCYFHFQGIKLSAVNVTIVMTAVGDLIFIFLQIIPAFAVMVNPQLRKTITEHPISEEIEHYSVDITFESFLNCFSYISDLFQVTVQSHLLVILSSPKFQMNFLQSASIKQMTGLKLVIGILTVGNTFYWVNGSFIEFNMHQNSLINNLVYGRKIWTGLCQFILPIALYFRFASALNLVEFYKNNLLRWEPAENIQAPNQSPANQSQT